MNGLGNILVTRRLLAANELVGRLPSEARPTDSFRPAVFLSRSSQVAMLKLEQWDRDHGAIEQNGIERLDLWLFFGRKIEEGISSSLRLRKPVVSKRPSELHREIRKIWFFVQPHWEGATGATRSLWGRS